ncbi:hypothetical protein C8Q74DRAFT_478019 [Fomes fomentarius]|nr:hypothetical protein C8Q74DRAFT_478019 [Fomes fomentarius]
MLIAECTSLVRRIFPQLLLLPSSYASSAATSMPAPNVLAIRTGTALLLSTCSNNLTGFLLHPYSDSALPRNQVYMAPGKTLGGCNRTPYGKHNRVWRDMRRSRTMLPSVCLLYTRHCAFHVGRAGCPWWWLMCVATQITSYSGSCQLELRWYAQPPCSRKGFYTVSAVVGSTVILSVQ